MFILRLSFMKGV